MGGVHAMHTPPRSFVRAVSTESVRPVLQGAAQLFAPYSAWHGRLLAETPETPRPHRVVIAGAAASGTAQVVDALLSEPHDAQVCVALRNKPAAAARAPHGALRIAYGATPEKEEGVLRVPLPWLHDREIVELIGTCLYADPNRPTQR